MAIQYEQKTFKKAGRVTEGQEAETYSANQLTADSISVDKPENTYREALEVCGNDVNVLHEVLIDGLNAYLRRLAGGSDEASKLAAAILKFGQGGGKSKAEIADMIRTGKLKLG